MPPQLRSSLLATFNSGFKLEDSGGGFFSHGHVYAPLTDGQATLISYSDGAVDIRTWTGGPDPGPGIAFARQNLPLIVEGGRLNPALRTTRCGERRSATPSASGARASASTLTATSSTRRPTSRPPRASRRSSSGQAPCERCSSTSTTSGRRSTSTERFGAGDPAKLLPGMSRPATRYLSQDDRDFFAVYAR